MSNAIILDAYPREKHGMATATFGMGVAIGTVFGSVFGGILAGMYNWRWAFFMIARASFLNLRLLRDRHYALSLTIVTVYDMLNFTPMVMTPPMLKDLVGFPESIIGVLVAARGR